METTVDILCSFISPSIHWCFLLSALTNGAYAMTGLSLKGAVATSIFCLWSVDQLPAHGALSVYGYTDQRHNLFYTGIDRDFIGDTNDPSGHALDWRGYSRLEGAYWSHITMISEHYYITAAHLPPATSPAGATAKFFETPGSLTPFVTTVSETVSGLPFGTHLPNSDLFIGKLDVAPPSWVPRYPLIKRPEQYNYIGLEEVSTEILIVGNGATSSFTDVRVGRNDLEHSHLSLYGEVKFEWTPELQADAAFTQDGDSAAPTFVVTHAGLALAGIHASGGKDSTISAYADIIQSLVPEHVSTVSDLPGDVNGDFVVDLDDFNIVTGNFYQSNMSPSQGDVDGDSVVNNTDLTFVMSNFGESLLSPADFNSDWKVDAADFHIIATNYGSFVASGTNGDVNGDSLVDAADFTAMNETWLFKPTNALPLPPAPYVDLFDANEDGIVNSSDRTANYNEVWANIFTFVTPGELGDFNLDGYVDLADANLVQSQPLKTGGWADLNNDSKVNSLDLTILLGHLGALPVPAHGDINRDGVINELDLSIMGGYWGLNIRFSDLLSGNIPEPSTATLAIAAVTSLAFARRKGKSHLFCGA